MILYLRALLLLMTIFVHIDVCARAHQIFVPRLRLSNRSHSGNSSHPGGLAPQLRWRLC